MELLIKRDPVILEEVDAKVEIFDWFPFKKITTPILVRYAEKYKMSYRGSSDDILVLNENDKIELDYDLLSKNQGLWSGCRSVLIRAEDYLLYKIKGVAFDRHSPESSIENGLIRIEGGQEKYSAKFEKQMTDKWNKILAKEGIEPAMECIGYWHYPVRAKRTAISASISQIRGDTRLDELFFIIENYYEYKMLNKKVIKEPLTKEINQLYKDLGFIVGRMKKLMDKNNQTWGSEHTSTNAHIGNVVLYPENEKIEVGFVDFDSSCDTNDFSKYKLRKIQKYECENLLNTGRNNVWTLRFIQAGASQGYITSHTQIRYTFRPMFAEGFEKGYEQSNSTLINNKIDKKRIDDIFFYLRHAGKLEEAVKKCIDPKEVLE